MSLARRAALELSRATAEGHVCLRLADLAARLAADAPDMADLASVRSRLLASGVVGTPEAPAAMPLLLDAQDRLYLHRHFDYERRLARRLLLAAQAAPTVVDAATRERLDSLFGRDALPDWQKLAAALALRQRLVVISGGPGTGKTSTVVNLLACLIAQDPQLRIALAAPTGKAAARLGEALRQRAAHLPQALRDKLPAQSHTVHRLLGAHPGGFRHHAGHPLAIDVLVVDEASMLDLALATRLLEAVPGSARLILLGDKDQLAAVESGAVFAELSADPPLSADCMQALADAVRRAGGADHAGRGRSRPARCATAWCGSRGTTASPPVRALPWPPTTSGWAVRASSSRGCAKRRTLRCTGWTTPGSRPAPPRCIAWPRVMRPTWTWCSATRRTWPPSPCAFERFRVLCALREGPRGVNADQRAAVAPGALAAGAAARCERARCAFAVVRRAAGDGAAQRPAAQALQRRHRHHAACRPTAA